MSTYLIRHAPTDSSRAYIVNGDPAISIYIGIPGLQACDACKAKLPISKIASCFASDFPRARQTAAALIGDPWRVTVERRLNEIDYGAFEGGEFMEYGHWLQANGGWAVPEGSTESQRDGIWRMLFGLRSILTHPAPRLVVGHGLMMSVLQWALANPDAEMNELFFPEAPYLEPLHIEDEAFSALLARLDSDLERHDREVSQADFQAGVLRDLSMG